MHSPMPFIVGSPRSGTTLLRLMLDSHPKLAIPPETGFLAQPSSQSTDPGDFLEMLTGSANWPDFNLDSDALSAALYAIPVFNPADAYRAFYRAYATRFFKPRYGDKTPSYVFHMQRIEELLPEAHFIHIIRDGRDVAISLRRQWFSPGKETAMQAKFWSDHVRAGRVSLNKIRRYLEVRYEDLILNTETTLSKICAFIEIDFSAAMLNYHKQAPARLLEHQGRNLANGFVLTKADRINQQIRTTSPPQKELVFGWRTVMTAEEVNEFHGTAGNLLNELGYDLHKVGQA
jgi:Sulfotransferase family